MFKLYDLNLREIPFPDGVMPLDIFVGSISKTRETETIPGRNGVMNYGFNYDSRPVRITLLAEGNDRVDYRLIRNAVFELFDLHDVFYIEETDVPSRVLKVTIDESYQPDRLTRDDASFDINLRTLDSVFWESKYTTLELHDSGYSATAEKYGLVDNIDDEKVKYRFEGTPYNENLMSSPYDYRSRLDSPFENILSAGLPTGNYTISFDYEVLSGNPSGFLLFAVGTLTTVTPTGGRVSANFSVDSENQNRGIRLYGDTGAAASRLTDVLFKNIKIERGNQATPFDGPSTKFSVYNAGNVTVEPESMLLNIIVSTVQSDNNFTIRNKTTGEEIVLKRASAGSYYRIQGMVISLGSITNIFRDTNRRFISLVPGDNQFEILNGTFGEIRFEFKYLYK